VAETWHDLSLPQCVVHLRTTRSQLPILSRHWNSSLPLNCPPLVSSAFCRLLGCRSLSFAIEEHTPHSDTRLTSRALDIGHTPVLSSDLLACTLRAFVITYNVSFSVNSWYACFLCQWLYPRSAFYVRQILWYCIQLVMTVASPSVQNPVHRHTILVPLFFPRHHYLLFSCVLALHAGERGLWSVMSLRLALSRSCSPRTELNSMPLSDRWAYISISCSATTCYYSVVFQSGPSFSSILSLSFSFFFRIFLPFLSAPSIL